ncbi:MAG: hypothetical protein E7167_05410 [Firmicutes bacterium]|nr:hypothetical protein [Bacillota bacterium]
MKKITFDEKLDAIVSYLFVLGFIPFFKKDKSVFLEKHLRRGKLLNIIIFIWLIFSIISFRILNITNILSTGAVQIIRLILYVINAIFCILILSYQLVWIVKIIKKKDC